MLPLPSTRLMVNVVGMMAVFWTIIWLLAVPLAPVPLRATTLARTGSDVHSAPADFVQEVAAAAA